MAKAKKTNYKIVCGFNLGYMPLSHKGDANWSEGIDKMVGDPMVLNELKNCYVGISINMLIPIQGKTLGEINKAVNEMKTDRDLAVAVNSIREAQLALVPFVTKGKLYDDYRTPIALNSDMWDLRVDHNKLVYNNSVNGWLTSENSDIELPIINTIESISKLKVTLALRPSFSTMYYLKSKSPINQVYTTEEFIEHRRKQMKLLGY